MAGWVERGTPEWTELRVHGVSGTPPESMLEHPTVQRVSGDASSGFYRRVWQAESIAEDTGATVLEAYSWGGLTAGSKLRALWLLLIPFLLANVAFYARPTHRPGFRQSFGEAVQRLFALTITATLVLATVNVSMDFLGWQCVRPDGGDSCGSSWTGWLSWPWLDSTGRRIAVTALLPLAVIALLWWLAHKTWAANETTRVDEVKAEAVQQSPLENRRMWNSAKPVRRLRAVHITGALALVGILALAPFTRDWPAGPTLGEVLMVILLAVGLSSVVLAVLPSMSDRPTRSEEAKGTGLTAVIVALPWLAVGLIVATLCWLWFAQPVPTGNPGATRTSLPWLSAAVHAGIAAQAVLLFVMVVLLTFMRRRSADPKNPIAWYGYATAVLMLFGSALSGAYAAALVLAVAHLLGKPMPRDVGIDPMVTPMPYFWAAAVALVLAASALLLGLGCYVFVRWVAGGRNLPAVLKDYPGNAGTDPRAKAIARQRAMATLDDKLRRVTGWFVVFMVLVIGAAAIGYRVNQTAVTDTAVLRGMANVGDWLIGLFAAGLIYLGRRAYQDANTRRIVGVIWDLGTFWPRAAHPLAPPCYAERAVPELINRIDFLRRNGDSDILLSCHSQGTILGAAVVMQLTFEQSRSVALLTYGSPLRRLYSRFFPAYFGPAELHRTGSFLLGGTDTPMADWPWRNLYRPSDPIGGPAFDPSCIDCRLQDPVYRKPAGDIADPPTLGHSFYPEDCSWAATVEEVKALRVAGRQSGHRVDVPLEPQLT